MMMKEEHFQMVVKPGMMPHFSDNFLFLTELFVPEGIFFTLC